MSHDRALEVKFGGEGAALLEGPGRAAQSARKTQPLRPPPCCAARPMRWRCGCSCTMRARIRPPCRPVRGRGKIFDAAEQARVEALGASAMRGVADNLDAALVDRCKREGWNHAEDRQNAPLADAISMLVRERVTGRPAPDDAKGLMQVWREDLESGAGGALDALAKRGRRSRGVCGGVCVR
jgi:cobaltochelatase CobT